MIHLKRLGVGVSIICLIILLGFFLVKFPEVGFGLVITIVILSWGYAVGYDLLKK